jgi:hypothetical protein
MSTATTSLPEILSGPLEHVATIATRRMGKRPSPATIWRWVRRGNRHGTVKLTAVCYAGYWATTEAALDQFLADQTAAALREDEFAGADGDAELRAAGLL